MHKRIGHKRDQLIVDGVIYISDNISRKCSDHKFNVIEKNIFY